MQTRLAQKEYGYGSGISLKRSYGLGGCTLHGHDFYELDIITGGHAEAVVNGKRALAERGRVFLMTPEDFHEYGDTAGLDVLNIQFYGDDVSSALLRSLIDSECREFALGEEDFDLICEIFEIMHKTNTRDGFAADILPRLLESVLLILHRFLRLTPDSDKQSACDVQAALIYVQEHFRENPPLSEVAALLSLNERYFCKKFKEYTGRTYKEYLRHTKLRYARKLLISTSLSVLEVCERCGYNTQSHFNREFKSEYGISPLDMRKVKK